MSWPAVPLRSTLGDWEEQTMAAGGPGDLGRPTTALFSIGRIRRDGRVRVIYIDMAHEKTAPPSDVLLRADLTVSEAVLALAYVRPNRAGVPPKVKGLRGKAVSPRTLAIQSGFAAFVALLGIVLNEPGILALAIPVWLLTFWAVIGGKTYSTYISPRVIDDGADVLASGVYARLPVDTSAADPGALTPRSRVDLVKERYGRLHSDVVYRIENSALFDGAVPQTQRFELALLAWDEAAPNAAQLATEAEASFDEARRHAERLGLEHLPETARDTGRRAARAAHTALHADNAGEREAARTRVAELLGSLALYYLPPVDPSAPQLLGERKQIEPR